ncbi:MAG: hypothetical protein Q4P13_09615 [Psychrobacter sp.]|nr:hypothetical protein [Psychrobacter sp.]
MNFQKQTQRGWLMVITSGLLGAMTLTMTGCDRSPSNDEDDAAKTTAKTSETEVVTKAVPVVACDDRLVQDQLKLVLQATLNQRSQNFAAAYAKQANIQVAPRDVNGLISNVLIDVQNPRVLQASNGSGMTTCQASVSMTLPSQNLYQASQVYAAAGRPDLQTQIAGKNVRLNNNMLVDDNFSYVVGTQGGEVRARIAGEPAILELVSDVMAGSVVQTAVEVRRAQIGGQKEQIRQERRAEQQNRRREPQEPRIRQPQPVKPATAAQPAKPANAPTPAAPVSRAPSTSTSTSNGASEPAKATTLPAANNTGNAKPTTDNSGQKQNVPTDKSIDMVIVEEDGTY